MKSSYPIFRRPAVCALLCVAAAVVLTSYSGAATADSPRKYRLKAAYMLNFAKFVEWPDDHTADHPDQVIVAILGEDPFGTLIDTIEKRRIRGKQVVVKRVLTVDELLPCDIVFISASETAKMREILDELATCPTLTVGEVDGFTEMGGIINFVITRNNTLRFEINAKRAEEVGLKMSSKLLRLAVRADR
jgi:hypothetical protein